MSWTIAGVDVPVQTDIELTASTLSVSFQVSSSELSTWREVGDRAGDLAVETGFGGALRTLSRGASGTITVDADAADTPPFATSEWHVAEFDEEQTAPQRHEIELELQRPTNRRDEFADLTDRAVSSGSRGFGRNFGRDFGAGDPDIGAYLALGGLGLTVAVTSDQIGQIEREGAAPGAHTTLPLVLSAEQAAAIADAAGYPEGVVDEAVADGESRLVDATGGRQTVTLDVRADVALEDGQWLLREWSIEWHSFATERRWRAELTLANPTS